MCLVESVSRCFSLLIFLGEWDKNVPKFLYKDSIAYDQPILRRDHNNYISTVIILASLEIWKQLSIMLKEYMLHIIHWAENGGKTSYHIHFVPVGSALVDACMQQQCYAPFLVVLQVHPLPLKPSPEAFTIMLV